MIRDLVRGWVWIRVFLGLCVEEVYLCGEFVVIDLVMEFMYIMGEEVEV